MLKNGFFQKLASSGPLSLISTSIRHKLLAGLLGVAIVPLVALGVTSYRSSEDALMKQAFNQLEAVKTIKANQVNSYFKTIEDQMLTFSEDLTIVQAMSDFKQSIETVREENGATPEEVAKMRDELRQYYANDFAAEYKNRTGGLPNTNAQMADLDDDEQKTSITCGSASSSFKNHPTFIQYQLV